LVKAPHGAIPVINRVTHDVEEQNLSQEKQFGFLHNFMGKYLVTWHNHIIYVLDPVTVKVISSCSQLKSILSVDVHKDEIFVVETGRTVIRISPRPEEIIFPVNNSKSIKDPVPGFKSDFRIPDQPFRLIASKIKETSRALPKFNSSSIITTMRNVLEADLNIQDGYIPNVIPLRAPEVPEIFLEPTLPLSPEVEQANSQEIEKFDKITGHSFQEVLLSQFKPEKKRPKKRNEDVMSVSDSISLSSQGSSNSEALMDSPERDRTFIRTPTSSSSSPSVSVGQLDQVQDSGRQEQEISPTELRSKEEMLAKMLKWSELLPSFEKGTSEINTDAQEVEPAPPLIQWIYSSDDDDQTESEPAATAISDVHDQGRQNFDFPTISQNSGHVKSEACSGNFTENKLTNGTVTSTSNRSDSISSAITDGLGESESFASIYDDSSGSHTLSIASSQDFFGPPSGSSNVTITEANSLTNATETGSSGIVEPHSIMASILPVQDMLVSGSPLNDYWVKYQLPSAVTSISSSDKYLFCIDARYSVYYTRLHRAEDQLCWIKADFQAIQLTSSSDGSTIWKIDPTGTLYTLYSLNEELFTENETWETISLKVKYAAIGSEIGFVIKTDNSLHVCRLPDPEASHIPSFEVLQTPTVFSSIHVLDDVVWALGSDGRIFYRSGIGYSPENWHGDSWHELKLNIPPVASISLGPQGTVWIVDIHNQIRFINDFILSRGKYKMWDVSISDDLITSATPFQQPTNSLGQVAQKLKESFRWAPSSLPIGSLPLLSSCHSIVSFTIRGGTSIFVNRTCLSGNESQFEPKSHLILFKLDFLSFVQAISGIR